MYIRCVCVYVHVIISIVPSLYVCKIFIFNCVFAWCMYTEQITCWILNTVIYVRRRRPYWPIHNRGPKTISRYWLNIILCGICSFSFSLSYCYYSIVYGVPAVFRFGSMTQRKKQIKKVNLKQSKSKKPYTHSPY